jgi:hypothetical protein
MTPEIAALDHHTREHLEALKQARTPQDVQAILQSHERWTFALKESRRARLAHEQERWRNSMPQSERRRAKGLSLNTRLMLLMPR